MALITIRNTVIATKNYDYLKIEDITEIAVTLVNH